MKVSTPWFSGLLMAVVAGNSVLRPSFGQELPAPSPCCGETQHLPAQTLGNTSLSLGWSDCCWDLVVPECCSPPPATVPPALPPSKPAAPKDDAGGTDTAIPVPRPTISNSSVSRPIVTLEPPEPLTAPPPARAVADPAWQAVPQRRPAPTDHGGTPVPPTVDDPAPIAPTALRTQPRVPTAATVWFARGLTGRSRR